MVRLKTRLFFIITFCSVICTTVFSADFKIFIFTKDNLSANNFSKAAHYLNENPDSSIIYAKKGILYSIKPKSLIKGHSILGDAYQYQQNFEKAIKHYLYAIKISDQTGASTVLANAYNGLGMAYFQLNDFDRAEFYLSKAADQKLEEKDYLYYSVIRSNLAVVYNRKEDYEKSNVVLHSTKKELIKTNNEVYLPSIYQSIGANYESGFNQLDSAIVYYKKSIEIAENTNQTELIKTGFFNLSGVAIKEKKYADALHFLNKVDAIQTTIKNNQFDLAVFNNYSEVYDSLGQYELAYYYKNKAFELNQELFNRDKQKIIEELDVKYQSAKKQEEIQKQKQALHLSQLESERSKNQLYILTFSSVLVILVLLVVVTYFWQKKKATQLLEKEKSKIFHNIVHEIRTPLTLISAPLELIKKNLPPSEKLSQQTHLIERNAKKLVKMVDELLNASKLEKGVYFPEYQDGDVLEFIKSSVTEFTNEAESKGISIQTSFGPRTSLYSFPIDVIEKTINNLISNSLKYCPKNSVVNISAKVENDFLLITVKDNGPGIPKKDHEKVFTRFYRVNEQLQNGTGIGLSMTKELVELVGGEIKLNSEKGKGASFVCKIPLQNSSSQSKPIVERENSLKILIVDDNIDILEFVSSVFEDSFDIILAQNGTQGINLAKEQLPDIILTDIMMPEVDGLALLKEVKKEELTQHIPIVVFSAKGSLDSRLKGLKFGADAYIPKPFSPEELQLTVENLLATIKRNQKDFQENIRANKIFNERLKSENAFINKACQFVIDNIDNTDYTINNLSADLCISRSQLHRKISSLTGFSSTYFIKMIRLEKSKDMLSKNEGNVTEIAYSCGFSSQSYFTKSFKEYFGKSPSEFLK